MRRRSLSLLLITFALAWVACGEDSPLDPDDNGGPAPIDLSSFNGCWHLTGTPHQRFGPESCRATLDSVLALLTAAAEDSLFAAIDDTISHLAFRAPYRGTGDFTGSAAEGPTAQVRATYRHNVGDCSLVTKIQGPVFTENANTTFFADFTVIVQFESGGCATDECRAFFTFEGVRHANSRCGNP